MSKEQVLGLINTNIKTNSGRVSPTKTTGVMLKEVLVALANASPESEDFSRTNTAAGSLNDHQYIQEFVQDPNLYNYSNISDNSYLDGDNGNFFMNIFRQLALQIQAAKDQAFDREAKFIVGREITNAMLEGTNWWVADGTNNTDDMRGRVALGGGYVSDIHGNNRTFSYSSSGGRLSHKLAETNIPRYDPANGVYKHLMAAGADLAGGTTDANAGDRDNTRTEPAIHGYNFTQSRIKTFGVTNPNPVDVLQPYITGTWIQYVKPDINPPSTPQNLTGTPGSTGTSITARWDVSTDDSGVKGYEVYLNGSLHGTYVTANYKMIIGLTPNTSYTIKVRAVDLFNKYSAFSTEITVTTPDVDTVAPSIPLNLTNRVLPIPTSPNSNVVDYNINLTWNESTDNRAVSSYTVERRRLGTSTWELLGSALQSPSSTGTINYTDPNVYSTGVVDVTWEFRVKAIDSSGNASGYSNITKAVIPGDDFIFDVDRGGGSFSDFS